MNLRQQTTRTVLFWSILLTAVTATYGQGGAETFTGTATVKTAGGATASAPVTITVERKMSQSEADKFLSAFKTGGVAGLRKELVGVAPTGSVQLGSGAPTPTRLALERATDKGRLLTLVTDKPVLLPGAGLPDAKPKEGYDLAVIDLVVDGKGSGSGTIAPAAKVTLNQGAFVVQDFASEPLQLTGVRKTK